MIRKIFCTLLIVGIAISTSSCLHMSVGVNTEYIPDFLMDKIKENPNKYKIEYVEYDKSSEFISGTNNSSGDETYETVYFAPRYFTELEELLQMRVDSLEGSKELTENRIGLIRDKVKEYIKIHNDTKDELKAYKDNYPTPREILERELEEFIGPVDRDKEPVNNIESNNGNILDRIGTDEAGVGVDI